MNLVPRPDAMKMFLFTYEEGALARVLDELSALVADGTLRWIVHMFNDKRMSAVNANRRDTPKWTGVGSVGGSPAYVAFATAELARRLGPLATGFHLVDEAQTEVEGGDPIVRGLYHLHTGRPNTTFMRGMYNSLEGVPRPENPDDLDHSRFGMLACLPLYPMDSGQVLEALRCVDEVCDRHGIVPAVTLNPIDADGLESVVNIYFDRADEAARDRAHRCNDDLHRTLHARGFRFYRVDIENMKHVMNRESPYWKTVQRLKAALDPANIIAPGRYGL
jgi:4-cresol dehydrogenase (hydroxylating)